MANIWTAATQSGNTPTETTRATSRSYRNAILATSISANATSIRFLFSNTTGASTMRIDGASIMERSGTTDDGVATPIRILFGGANTATIAAGQTLYSDWLTFTIDETKDYLVHLYVTAGDTWSADIWDDSTVPNTHYYDTSGTDYTLTQTVSFGTHTNIIGLSAIDAAVVTIIGGFMTTNSKFLS